MASSPSVYIVLLTYNHYADTYRALLSLRAITYPNARVLVMDNGSTDETCVQLPRDFPEVDLRRNSANLGFSAGMNAGLRLILEVDADFVLILNNDVVVAPDLLEALLSEATEGVGAVSPIIYSMREPTRIWSAGFTRHRVLLEMRGGARGELDEGEWAGPREVDYLLGCALLIPIPVLREVGLFDERYFFYYEDLDLSWRIKARGYRLLVTAEARVWHEGAVTAGHVSPFYVYHRARGSVIFFRSHARGMQRMWVFLHRLGSSLRKSSEFIMGGRWDLFRHHWRGIRDGWRSAGGP